MNNNNQQPVNQPAGDQKVQRARVKFADVGVCRYGAGCRFRGTGRCRFQHPDAPPAEPAPFIAAPLRLPVVPRPEPADNRAMPPLPLREKEALWFKARHGMSFLAVADTAVANISKHEHVKLALERALSEIIVSSFVGNDAVVLDVGGNPIRARNNARDHWWACAPKLSPLDMARNERNSRELGAPAANNGWCEHRGEDCKCVNADFALFSHSAYYIRKEDVLAIIGRTTTKRGFIIAHRFDTPVGNFNGPNGVEATWRPSANDPGAVVMSVKGNNHPYEHPRADWIHAGVVVDGPRTLVIQEKRTVMDTYIYECTVGETPAVTIPRGITFTAIAAAGGCPYGPVDVTSVLTRHNLDLSDVNVTLVGVKQLYAVGKYVVARDNNTESVVVPRDLIAHCGVTALGTDRTTPRTFSNILASAKVQIKHMNVPAADQPLAILWAATIAFGMTIEHEIAAAKGSTRNEAFQEKAVELASYAGGATSVDVQYRIRRAVRVAVVSTVISVAVIAALAFFVNAVGAWRASHREQLCLERLTYFDHAFGYVDTDCRTTGWLVHVPRRPPLAFMSAVRAGARGLSRAGNDLVDAVVRYCYILYDGWCPTRSALFRNTFVDARCRELEAARISAERWAGVVSAALGVLAAAVAAVFAAYFSRLPAHDGRRVHIDIRPARGPLVSIDSTATVPPREPRAKLGEPSRPGVAESPAPVRIGPSFGDCGAVAFNSNAHNMFKALSNRFTKQKEHVSLTHGASYLSYVSAFSKALFPAAPTQPLPFEEWVKRFPAHRRVELQAAEAARLSGKPTRNVSGGFVKREVSGLIDEKHTVSAAADKAPRCIAPQDDSRLVVTGPVDAAIHDWLKLCWPLPRWHDGASPIHTNSMLGDIRPSGLVYATGCPSHVYGDIHRVHQLRNSALRETDGSRFDSAMNWATDAVERYVIENALRLTNVDNEEGYARLTQYLAEWNERSEVRGRTVFGQRYTAAFSRASGDTATTVRNSLTNGLLQAYSASVACGNFPCRYAAYPVRPLVPLSDLQLACDRATQDCPVVLLLDHYPEKRAGDEHVFDDEACSEWIHNIRARWPHVCVLLPPSRFKVDALGRCTSIEHPAVPTYVESYPIGRTELKGHEPHTGTTHLPQILVAGDDSIAYFPCALTKKRHQALDYVVLSLGLRLKTVDKNDYHLATFCSAMYQPCMRDGVVTFALRQRLDRVPRRGFGVDLPAGVSHQALVAGNAMSTRTADAGSPIHEAVNRAMAAFGGDATPHLTHDARHRLAESRGLRRSYVCADYYAAMENMYGLNADMIDIISEYLATPRPEGWTPAHDFIDHVFEEIERGEVPPCVVSEVAPGVNNLRVYNHEQPLPLPRPGRSSLVPALSLTPETFICPVFEELFKVGAIVVSWPFGLLYPAFEASCHALNDDARSALIAVIAHCCLMVIAALSITAFGFEGRAARFFSGYVPALVLHWFWNWNADSDLSASVVLRRAIAAIENDQFSTKNPNAMMNGKARKAAQRLLNAKNKHQDKVAKRASAQPRSKTPRPATAPLKSVLKKKLDEPKKSLVETKSSGKFLPLLAAAVPAVAGVVKAAHEHLGRQPRAPPAPRAEGSAGAWAIKSASPYATTHLLPKRSVGTAAVAAAAPDVKMPKIDATGPAGATAVSTAKVALGTSIEKGEARTRQATFHRFGANGKIEERRGTLVETKELVGTVRGTDAFTVASRNVNPGSPDAFPWLANVSANYDEFSINDLRYEFITEAATSSKGKVYLSLDYEVTDPVPASRIMMADLYATVSSAVWNNQELHYRPTAAANSTYYVSGPASTANGNNDPRVTSPANLLIATVDCTDTGVVGEVYSEYGVFLFEPNLITAQSNVSTNGTVTTFTVNGDEPNGYAGVPTPVPRAAGPAWGSSNTYPSPALISNATGLYQYRSDTPTFQDGRQSGQFNLPTLVVPLPATYVGGLYAPINGTYVVTLSFDGAAPASGTFTEGGAISVINCAIATGAAALSATSSGHNLKYSSTAMVRVVVTANNTPATQPPLVILQLNPGVNIGTITTVRCNVTVMAYNNDVLSVTAYGRDNGDGTGSVGTRTLTRRFGNLETEDVTGVVKLPTESKSFSFDDSGLSTDTFIRVDAKECHTDRKDPADQHAKRPERLYVPVTANGVQRRPP